MKRGDQKIIVLALLFSEAARASNAAGGVLQGVAQIIQGVAPIVVAGIQAKADVKIAAINADAAIKTTQITADTSKELSNIQKDIAIYQAETSKEINKINNDATTERLGMQLSELRAAREDARDSEREKRRIEMMYNNTRIELAKQQAADQFKLAQMTLKAQLTQAGLISGFKSIDSSRGLTVSQIGMGSSGGVSSGQLASSRLVTRLSRGMATTSGTSAMSRRLLETLAGRDSVERPARAPASLGSILPGSLISGSTVAARFKADKPVAEVTAFRRIPVLADAEEYRPRVSQSPFQAGGHSGGARGIMGN